MLSWLPEAGAGVVLFTAPIHAIPLDLFRILAGLVGCAYFVRALLDVPDLSAPDGLIDHELCRRVFPPSRMTLFRPGIPKVGFRVVFAAACLASLCVSAGYHTKSAAFSLFIIAVSTYRWHLLAVYVDDAIVHLMFLWLVLLPVGSTLTLEGWWASGMKLDPAWLTATVPGGAARAFLANMALVYLVAGLYKFTSPMWREGKALQAILQLPIARTPVRSWSARHPRLLRWGNDWALAMEPLLAVLFLMPANSPAKWFLVLSAMAFHVGIIATLKIPFANLAMLGALSVALGPEIMMLLGQQQPTSLDVAPLSPSQMVAVALIVALGFMVVWEALRSRMLNDLPLWKTHMQGFLGNPMYVLLWLFGIAQSYRLFDWIDTRNYHVRYEVVVRPEFGVSLKRSIDPVELFPTSLRHCLLQSYIFGSVWLQMPTQQLAAVRTSLLARHAQRFARRHPNVGTVEVHAIVQRITSDNLDLDRGERRFLMRFRCRGGVAHYLDATPAGMK